jgi:hypothetical protein
MDTAAQFNVTQYVVFVRFHHDSGDVDLEECHILPSWGDARILINRHIDSFVGEFKARDIQRYRDSLEDMCKHPSDIGDFRMFFGFDGTFKIATVPVVSLANAVS